MADDTPTVGEATRALLVEIDDCIERAFAQQGKGSGRIVELIDALIAKVRAEHSVTASTGKPGTVGEHLTSGNAKKER